MSQHTEEAAIRGHGPRPVVCDHDGTVVQLGSGCTAWCRRCGAISPASGRWEVPPMLAAAVRDRDTMHETLTIAQERGTALVKENRGLKERLGWPRT
jgi:hypothetical protein